MRTSTLIGWEHAVPRGRLSQSSGSTFTSRWSWLLPTQNVTGVVELSTNTVILGPHPKSRSSAARQRGPFTASAEPATKRPLIAWLSGGSQKASWVFVEAFLQGMRAAFALVLSSPQLSQLRFTA